MRVASAREADNLDWTVGVQWHPRPLGLVRKFGGWRDKRRSPDQGGDIVADIVDGATSPYPDWNYTPARHTSGGLTGGHTGSSFDLPGGHRGGGGGGGWDLGDHDDGFMIVIAIVTACSRWSRPRPRSGG